MTGVLILKASQRDEISIPQTSVLSHGEIYLSEFEESVEVLEDIEPAAGGEEDTEEPEIAREEEVEEMKKLSGHARDGVQKEGLEALKENESGLPDYVSFTAPDSKRIIMNII